MSAESPPSGSSIESESSGGMDARNIGSLAAGGAQAARDDAGSFSDGFSSGPRSPPSPISPCSSGSAPAPAIKVTGNWHHADSSSSSSSSSSSAASSSPPSFGRSPGRTSSSSSSEESDESEDEEPGPGSVGDPESRRGTESTVFSALSAEDVQRAAEELDSGSSVSSAGGPVSSGSSSFSADQDRDQDQDHDHDSDSSGLLASSSSDSGLAFNQPDSERDYERPPPLAVGSVTESEADESDPERRPPPLTASSKSASSADFDDSLSSADSQLPALAPAPVNDDDDGGGRRPATTTTGPLPRVAGADRPDAPPGADPGRHGRQPTRPTPTNPLRRLQSDDEESLFNVSSTSTTPSSALQAPRRLQRLQRMGSAESSGTSDGLYELDDDDDELSSSTSLEAGSSTDSSSLGGDWSDHREASAARRIQAAARGRRERIRLREQRAAARHIQRVTRGRCARRHFVRQRSAAVRIQAVERGRRTRQELADEAEMDDIVAHTDLSVLSAMSFYALSEDQAAARIQAVLRGRLERRRARRRPRSREAAVVRLQAAERGRRGRRRAKLVPRTKEEAVVRLQAAERGRRGRRRARIVPRTKDEAAARMQAVARGRRDRRRAKLVPKTYEEAVVRLQAAERGRRGRRRAKIVPRTKEEAAARMQAAARGRRDRRRVKRIPRTYDEAAVRVQAAARGRRDRRRAKLVPKTYEEAVLRLQAAERGRRGRRRAKIVPRTKDEAAARMQAAARGRRDRRRVKRIPRTYDEAAVRLQAGERGRRGRRRAKLVPRTYDEAAVRLQAGERGRRGRRRAKIVPRTYDEAAVRIQAPVRRFLTLQRLARAVRGVQRIQAAVRGRAARRAMPSPLVMAMRRWLTSLALQELEQAALFTGRLLRTEVAQQLLGGSDQGEAIALVTRVRSALRGVCVASNGVAEALDDAGAVASAVQQVTGRPAADCDELTRLALEARRVWAPRAALASSNAPSGRPAAAARSALRLHRGLDGRDMLLRMRGALDAASDATEAALAVAVRVALGDGASAEEEALRDATAVLTAARVLAAGRGARIAQPRAFGAIEPSDPPTLVLDALDLLGAEMMQPAPPSPRRRLPREERAAPTSPLRRSSDVAAARLALGLARPEPPDEYESDFDEDDEVDEPSEWKAQLQAMATRVRSEVLAAPTPEADGDDDDDTQLHVLLLAPPCAAPTTFVEAWLVQTSAAASAGDVVRAGLELAGAAQADVSSGLSAELSLRCDPAQAQVQVLTERVSLWWRGDGAPAAERVRFEVRVAEGAGPSPVQLTLDVSALGGAFLSETFAWRVAAAAGPEGSGAPEPLALPRRPRRPEGFARGPRALIVAADEYAHEELVGVAAVAPALALEGALRAHGFSVVRLLNSAATLGAVRAALEQLRGDSARVVVCLGAQPPMGRGCNAASEDPFAHFLCHDSDPADLAGSALPLRALAAGGRATGARNALFVLPGQSAGFPVHPFCGGERGATVEVLTAGKVEPSVLGWRGADALLAAAEACAPFAADLAFALSPAGPFGAGPVDTRDVAQWLQRSGWPDLVHGLLAQRGGRRMQFDIPPDPDVLAADAAARAARADAARRIQRLWRAHLTRARTVLALRANMAQESAGVLASELLGNRREQRQLARELGRLGVSPGRLGVVGLSLAEGSALGLSRLEAAPHVPPPGGVAPGALWEQARAQAARIAQLRRQNEAMRAALARGYRGRPVAGGRRVVSPVSVLPGTVPPLQPVPPPRPASASSASSVGLSPSVGLSSPAASSTSGDDYGSDFSGSGDEQPAGPLSLRERRNSALAVARAGLSWIDHKPEKHDPFERRASLGPVPAP